VAARKRAAGILPAEAASDHKARFGYHGLASIRRRDAGSTLCGHDVQMPPQLYLVKIKYCHARQFAVYFFALKVQSPACEGQ
jgi:hypothetical protein